MKKSIFCLILVIFFSFFVLADEYYVSPAGNDSNSGTSSQPFMTLKKAASEAGPGDICYIEGGIYRETLKPSLSGTDTDPVIFTAQPGEEVLITALDTISEWSEHAKDVFVADVNHEITQVFIDGEPAYQARYPNTKSTNPFNFESFPLSLTENSVISTKLDQAANYWKGGIVWAIVGERWISQVADIEASSQGELSITANSWPENTGEGIGYITGTLAAMDTAGEWHYENSKLYLQLAPGDTPDNHVIELKTREWVIDLNGKKHITVRNIKTTGGAVNMNRCSHSTLDNLNVRWLSHFVDIETASTSWLRHEWTNINYEGIGVGIFGDHNTVKNCDIAWSAGDGVTLFGDSNRVENCIIHDCNYSGTDCNPITLMGKGNIVTRNTVYNGGRGLIFIIFAKQSMITYNEVYNASLVNRDVGGIYSWGTDAEGTAIAYNWVHDIISEGGYEIGNGIYIDNFCANITVHHNVIWNCSYNAFNYSRPAKNVYWFNNTAFSSPDVDYSYIPEGYADTSSGNKMYNNLLSYTIGDFDSLKKRNNLTLSELPLRSAGDFDFRLRSDASEAIDKGIVIPGITDGYVGDAPDIGAYENGSVFWKPGVGTVDTVPVTVSPARAIRKKMNPFLIQPRASIVTMNVSRSFNGRCWLMNTQGKIVTVLHEGSFKKGTMRFDLNRYWLPSGMYILVVHDISDIHSGEHRKILKL